MSSKKFIVATPLLVVIYSDYKGIFLMQLSIANQSEVWIERWEEIRRLVHVCLENFKRKWPEAQKIEVINQPARTMIIRSNEKPGALVQISMSLRGDEVEIIQDVTIPSGYTVRENTQPIKIRVVNEVIVYTHEDKPVPAGEVAEIILFPILDCYRANWA